jgi:hypothetical protein
MTLTRRTVLAAATALPAVGMAACARKDDTPPTLSGKIHAIGFLGQRHTQGMALWRTGVFDSPSVLTTLDLADGTVRQTALPLRGGHSVTPLSGGALLCLPLAGEHALVVDATHTVIRQLDAGDGLAFGGHGWEDTAQNVVIVPLMVRDARSIKDQGILRVYDRTSWQVVANHPSGGLQPHELIALPRTDQLALAHYGSLRQIGREGMFAFSPLEPLVAIYDRTTRALTHRHVLPALNGVATHLTAAPNGDLITVTNQYLMFTRDDEQSLLAALAAYERLYGAPPPDLPQALIEETRLALPLAVYRLSPEGAATAMGNGDPALRRSQSVTTHHASGHVVATFAHSNTLWVLPPQGQHRTVSAGTWGVQDVRGVADLSPAPYLLVSGKHGGVAVVNIHTLTAENLFDVPLFGAAHLSYTA